MSYLQALQKKVPNQNYTETSIATPDTTGDAKAKKWYESLTPEQQQRLKSKVESHFSKKNPEMVANQKKNENIEMNRSKQQALLKEQYKKDKEWQDKKDQTALQNQQKEVEAARNAEIKRRNAEIKRKQNVKVDTRGYQLYLLESESVIENAKLVIDEINEKLERFGLENQTIDDRERLQESKKIIEIENFKRDTMLLELITAAAEKYGEEGKQKLIDQGISMDEIDRVTK